eukprot:1059479-Pleurochrysis_carterae.AAC.1
MPPHRRPERAAKRMTLSCGGNTSPLFGEGVVLAALQLPQAHVQRSSPRQTPPHHVLAFCKK